MRRRRTAVALAALALVLTTACTPDGSTPPTPTVTTTAGPIQVTLAVYGPPAVISAYTTIAANFSAKNPGVAINVRPYATHDEAMTDLARTRGTKQAPDIYLAGADDLPELIRTKANQRVDQMLQARNIDFGDGYERQAIEAFSADTALQCMPVGVSPLVVYYNPALVHLAQLRPPGQKVPNPDDGWRFEDFAAAAQQASVGGVKGVYVAPDVQQVAPFLFSGGGKLVDDETKPTTTTFSDGADTGAMNTLLAVVRNPALTFSSAQLAKRDAITRFKAGKLAMILGFRDLTPELRNQAGLRFAVMPIPRIGRSSTVLDISGLCVKPNLPHRTSTANFLAYLVGTQASQILAASGYVVPANANVLYSEAFTQPTLDPAGSTVFSSQIRYATRLPTGPTWDAAEQIVDGQLFRLFNDAVIDPLDDRLTEIDQAAKDALGGTTPSASPSASETP